MLMLMVLVVMLMSAFDDGDDFCDADAGAPGHDGDGVDTNSHVDDDAAAGNYHS